MTIHQSDDWPNCHKLTNAVALPVCCYTHMLCPAWSSINSKRAHQVYVTHIRNRWLIRKTKMASETVLGASINLSYWGVSMNPSWFQHLDETFHADL